MAVCQSPKLSIPQALDTLQNRIKIVICGDGSVGKTCVLMAYALKVFPTDYVPTVYDNYHMDVTVEGRQVDVEVVDTAGQEDFVQIRQLGYKGANVLIICYDVSNPTSFNNIKEIWIPELKGNGADSDTKDIPLVIAGTKSDLKSIDSEYNGPFVKASSARRVARAIGASGPVECSALANDNVNNLFNKAIQKAIAVKQQSSNSCNIL